MTTVSKLFFTIMVVTSARTWKMLVKSKSLTFLRLMFRASSSRSKPTQYLGFEVGVKGGEGRGVGIEM